MAIEVFNRKEIKYLITDEDKAANLEKKLAKSMRGVMLKRFKDDATYSREVYGYNLFGSISSVSCFPRTGYVMTSGDSAYQDGRA